jgi:hypothetical protein
MTNVLDMSHIRSYKFHVRFSKTVKWKSIVWPDQRIPFADCLGNPQSFGDLAKNLLDALAEHLSWCHGSAHSCDRSNHRIVGRVQAPIVMWFVTALCAS